MNWTQFFIPTSKEVPAGTEAASHQLLLRAGLVNMLTSGVYSYLPLGLRVLRRVETIIREEMDAAGAVEVFLPCLQPMELWNKTGRDEVMKDIMIRFRDQKGKDMCLGPTHEEVITSLAGNYIQSYRQLPVTLYQIQTKFRDELRTRFGIVRACEFIMKDAYSFDRDEAGMRENYQKMYAAYEKIFSRCGLNYHIVSADSGAMGGDVSHEFMVPAPIGEDTVLVCASCGKAFPFSDEAETQKCPSCKDGALRQEVAIELGHVFQLGTKYSAALDAVYLDEDGRRKPMIMGCYGIGVSRLIAAAIETNHDHKGIVWPLALSPFPVEILPLKTDDPETMRLAGEYASRLFNEGWEVLVDDRDESPGKKFNDADLIGLPYRIVLGQRALKDGNVEIKVRRSGETVMAKKDEAPALLMKMMDDMG